MSTWAELLAHRINRGVAAFNAGEFAQALRQFDATLCLFADEQLPLELNGLLSQISEEGRLKDFQAALNETRKLTHLAARSGKGAASGTHLFGGRVAKLVAAIRIFNAAIVHSKTGLPLLQRLHIQLGQVLKEEHLRVSKDAVNDIGTLPHELLLKVVSYLDARSRFLCTRVCRVWRQLVMTTPSLWNSISLGESPRGTIQAVLYWMERLGPYQQLESIDISVSSVPTLRTLLGTFDSFMRQSRVGFPGRHLQSLSIDTSGMPPSSTRDINNLVSRLIVLNRDTLIQLSLRSKSCLFFVCPLHVVLKFLPKLRYLDLRGWPPSPTEQMHVLLTKADLHSFVPDDQALQPATVATRLEHLRLHNVRFYGFDLETEVWVHASYLQVLSLVNFPDVDRRHRIIKLCKLSSLSHLELGETILASPTHQTIYSFSNLHNLQLHGYCRVLQDAFPALCLPVHGDLGPEQQAELKQTEPFATELRHLGFHQTDSNLTFRFLSIFAYQFSQLESLLVSGVELGSDSQRLLLEALQDLPPLYRLELTNMPIKSEVWDAVKLGRLKKLNISDCYEVTFSSLSRLVQPGLELLNISGCRVISSTRQDTIQWLGRHTHTLIR